MDENVSLAIDIGIETSWPDCLPLRPYPSDYYLHNIGDKIVDNFQSQTRTTKIFWSPSLLTTTIPLPLGNDKYYQPGPRRKVTHNIIIPAQSKLEVFTLGVSCSSYTLTIDKLFTRVYDLDMKCIGKPNPVGIEDCQFCLYKPKPTSDEIQLKDGSC